MRGSRLGVVGSGIGCGNSMEQDSFDSSDSSSMPMDEDLNRVVATNHRNSVGGVVHNGDQEIDERSRARSIIVTNVDINVFDDRNLKRGFESLFLAFDPLALFHFLRSFRRVRVDFADHNAADKAKRAMDNTTVADSTIHCYALQVGSSLSSDTLLHVPPVERQFLLSPPASPPVGWNQPMEDRPIMPDHQLAQAMAELMPGEKHELHPMREINVLGKSVSTPSIVVHVAEPSEETIFPDNMATGSPPLSMRCRQNTRCPDRQRSLD